MTAKRRVTWNEVWEESWAVWLVAVFVLILIATGLMSQRGVEWMAITKLVAIAAVVIAASKLRDEWVAGAAMLLLVVAVVPWALVELERGKWVETAILAAMVVLTLRLGNAVGDAGAR